MVQHATRLERRPPGLEFPPSLADRMSYDEATHRLVFRGFMSKADFDRLLQLSDDWSYRRALEDLFREATPESEDEEDRPRRGLAGFLHGIGLL